jgi:UDP-N-acetyl-D-glucosamine dehydrogenase
MNSMELSPRYLSEQDCVLIVTDHSAYDYDLIVAHAPLVVGTRNATQAVTIGRQKVVRRKNGVLQPILLGIARRMLRRFR